MQMLFSVSNLLNFIILRDSFWMYFYWINMPNMTQKKTFLIVVFNVD